MTAQATSLCRYCGEPEFQIPKVRIFKNSDPGCQLVFSFRRDTEVVSDDSQIGLEVVEPWAQLLVSVSRIRSSSVCELCVELVCVSQADKRAGRVVIEPISDCLVSWVESFFFFFMSRILVVGEPLPFYARGFSRHQFRPSEGENS